MKMKKVLALLLAGSLGATLLTGCGGSSSATDSTGSDSGDKVSFTIFNSKTEIQEYLEEAAATYGEEHNVDIEVYFSSDTVSAHLASKYAANDPYTINMVDAKDVYSLGKQYGYDMSDAEWVSDTDYAISVDDKVVGFPVCIEARGILYNNKAIKAVTGEDFDPSTIQTLDDFDAFCQKLVDGGIEKPCSILKPDWSLGAHYFQQIYEEHDDVESFIHSLYAGTADLENDEKFNSLMDTFDTLMKYNTWGDSPIAVEDDQVHQVMAEAQVAFQFGGCWEWNDIIDYDYEPGSIGLMAVPQNLDDEFTGKIVGGGSKYFYIDNSDNTSAEQQEAAAEFLEWLASSDEGKTLVSETCAMVSPFKSNTVPCANELGQYVKEFADAGNMIPNYDYDPDDHYSIIGAAMQKYLSGNCDRAELATEVQDYWSTVTPVEH